MHPIKPQTCWWGCIPFSWGTESSPQEILAFWSQCCSGGLALQGSHRVWHHFLFSLAALPSLSLRILSISHIGFFPFLESMSDLIMYMSTSSLDLTFGHRKYSCNNHFNSHVYSVYYHLSSVSCLGVLTGWFFFFLLLHCMLYFPASLPALWHFTGYCKFLILPFWVLGNIHIPLAVLAHCC